jgi:hypothetical protein
MATEISPALQALLLEQADAFKRDVESALIEMDALTFYRWSADRQLDLAREFARTARKEREAPKPRPSLEQLITAQRVNDARNTCDCVHCAPFLRAVHGNGCSGYHCAGTCIAVPLERCGRCGTVTLPDLIAVTGPYRTCPTCTAAIRS